MINSLMTLVFNDHVIKFSNLGKVNALCGKNNSGKSTVLNAIVNYEGTKFGYSLGLQHFDFEDENYGQYQFTKEEVNTFDDYIKSSEIPHAERVDRRNYFKVLADIRNSFRFNEEPITVIASKDFIKPFIDKYISAYRVSFQEQNKYAINHITSVKESYYLAIIDKTMDKLRIEKPRYVLSAKRNLSVKASVGTHDDPIGEIYNDDKLVEGLFAAKNSEDDSVDKTKYLAVKKEFKYITQKYDFDILLDKRDCLLKFSNHSSEWMLADDSGLGLRDILSIISNCIFFDKGLLLIEEPESHLHPEVQRRLLDFMKFRCKPQILLTTHSSVFLDTSYIDSIHVCKMNEDGITVKNEEKKLVALQELGYLSVDNIIANTLLLVEGITDIPVIEEFLRKFDDKFDEYVKLMSLGSVSNLAALDLDIVSNGYEMVFAVIDGDNNVNTLKAVKQLKLKVKKYENVEVIELDGYGIENYLSCRAVDEKSNPPSKELTSLMTSDYFPPDIKIVGMAKNSNYYRNIARNMTKQEVYSSHDIHEKLIKKIIIDTSLNGNQ